MFLIAGRAKSAFMASTRSLAVEDDDYDAPQTVTQASVGATRVSATSATVSRSSIEHQQLQRLIPALPSHNANAAPLAPVPVIPAPSPEVTRLLRGFLKQSVGMQAVFLVSPPPAVANAKPVHLLAAFLSLPQSVRTELFQAQPNHSNYGGNVRAAITHLTKSLSPAEREYIASVAAAVSRTGSSSERRPSEANAAPLIELRQYIEQHSAIVATMRANFDKELNFVAAATAASSAQSSSSRRTASRSAPTSSPGTSATAFSSTAPSLPPTRAASEAADEIRLFLLGPVPDVFAPRAADAFQFDDDQYPIDSATSISHGSSPSDATLSSSVSWASSSLPESASTSSSFFTSRSGEHGALFQAEAGIFDPHAGRTHLPVTTTAAAATTVGVRHATDLAAAAALRSLPPFMRGRNVAHTPLAAEVAAMMHAFGDVARPSPAAVLALADYVRAWMTPIVAQLSTLRGTDQIAKLQQQFPLVCRLYFQFQIARRQVKDCDPARFASQSLRAESDAGNNAASVTAAARPSPRITASSASDATLPSAMSAGLGFGSAPPSPSLPSSPSSRLPASIATFEDVFIHADRAADDDDARLFGANGQHIVIDNVESSGGMVEVEDGDHVSDSEERLRDDEPTCAAVKRQRDDAALPIADSASVEISSSSSSSASSSSTSSSSLPSDDADFAADAAVHCLSYEAHLPALDLVVGPRQRQRVFASLTTRLMSEAAYLAFSRARTVSFACGSARTAFLHAIGSSGDGGSSTTTSTLHATALTLLGLIAWDRVGLIVEIALELRRRRPGSGPRVAYFDVTLAMHLVQAWSWLLHQLEMVAGGLGAGSDEIPRAVETSEQRLSKRTKRGITSSRSIH